MVRYKHTGENRQIVTNSGILIANNFTRIVHGGRGDYIEIDNNSIRREVLHIPAYAQYRVNSAVVYYVEYRTPDNVMLYFQKKTVSYADYKIGYWYVSPEFIKNFEPITKKQPALF